MMAWMFMVARRYFATKRREKSLASSFISVLGLGIGTATLIVVIGAMNGFQLGFIDPILAVSSYHVVARPEEALRGRDLEAAVDRIRALPGTQAAVPFFDLEGITSVRGVAGEKAIKLRAIPAEFAAIDPDLAAHLVRISGDIALPAADSIIVGNELAAGLGLRKGSRVRVSTISGDPARGVDPIAVDFTVAGVFKTGFYEFDLAWAFFSLDSFAARFGYEPEAAIGIKLLDREADGPYIAALAKAEGLGRLGARSWRDSNRAYFSALSTEKTVMMLVIGLVFIIVAVSIYHALRRSVYEREEEIAVMRAMGASPESIRIIFISEGLIIGLLGGLIGLALGLLLTAYINETLQGVQEAIGFVSGLWDRLVRGVDPRESVELFSSSVFYIDRVPTRLLPGELLGIFLAACSSAGLAAWLASRRISKIRPSEVIRYE